MVDCFLITSDELCVNKLFLCFDFRMVGRIFFSATMLRCSDQIRCHLDRLEWPVPDSERKFRRFTLTKSWLVRMTRYSLQIKDAHYTLSWSSLVEGDEGCNGPTGKLLWTKLKNYAPHAHGSIPYLFDFWADPVVYLLLLMSSMT